MSLNGVCSDGIQVNGHNFITSQMPTSPYLPAHSSCTDFFRLFLGVDHASEKLPFSDEEGLSAASVRLAENTDNDLRYLTVRSGIRTCNYSPILVTRRYMEITLAALGGINNAIGSMKGLLQNSFSQTPSVVLQFLKLIGMCLSRDSPITPFHCKSDRTYWTTL